jgi:hypothetical protein
MKDFFCYETVIKTQAISASLTTHTFAADKGFLQKTPL